MDTALDVILTAYTPEIRSLAFQTRDLILKIIPEAVEVVDAPSKIIAYGTDKTYTGLICAIAPQRAYVNLMFSRGVELPDPAAILEGTGKRARHVKIRTQADLTNPAVSALLKAATQLSGKQKK